MDVDKLAIDLLLKGMTQEQQTIALESIKDSVAQAKTIQKKRPKLLLSNAVRGPFSFINAIVFPTHLYQSEAYELMLTHEKIHVKQWHSLDILLTHIMFVFTWWNPFLWW